MGREQLQRALDSLPPQFRENQQTESVALAGGVIRGFLGNTWIDRHAGNQKKRGIFTVSEGDPVEKELSFLRLVDLAEVLYNLQHAPGFDECISRLRDGVIEGTMAELDFGRLLYFNRVPFRFVIPQKIKKKDYDIEILYPNEVVACADAKCKIQTTEFSENGIRNILNEAREQLPNDKPGIVFVKVPSNWIRNAEFLSIAIHRANRFLGGVSRIVSVKFYGSQLTFKDNRVTHDHAYKEVSNPKTDFGNDVDWDIFKPLFPRPTRKGIPDHWQRILFFPDGIER